MVTHIVPSHSGTSFLTKKNDFTHVFNGETIFGLGGNDVFDTIGSGMFTIYGGQGNDTININNHSGSQFVYLYDSGGKKDTLNAYAYWASSTYYLEYGPHLAMLDIGDLNNPDFLMLLNWKKRQNRFERIRSGDGFSWNFSQFKRALLNGEGYMGKFNTSEIRAFTGVGVPNLRAYNKKIKQIKKLEKKNKNKKRFTENVYENVNLENQNTTMSWNNFYYTKNSETPLLIDSNEKFNKDIYSFQISNLHNAEEFDLNLLFTESKKNGGLIPYGFDATYAHLKNHHRWIGTLGYREYEHNDVPIINSSNVPYLVNQGGTGLFLRGIYKFEASDNWEFYASSELGEIIPDFSMNPIINLESNIVYLKLKSGFKHQINQTQDSLSVGITNGFNPISGSFENKIPELFGDKSVNIGFEPNPYFIETSYNKLLGENTSLNLTVINSPQLGIKSSSVFANVNINF